MPQEIMKTIANSLEVHPLIIEDEPETQLPTSEPSIELTPEEKQAKEDFEFSRASSIRILEKAEKAINRMSVIADKKETARDYEVLGKMIKDTLDAHQNLLKLHEQKLGLVTSETPKEEKNITNNTIVVGSAAELLDMIEQKRKLKDVSSTD